MVSIADVDELKEISPEEYHILKEQNISSLLVTPIRSTAEKKVTGFIGVDNPSMFTEDHSLLDTLSYFINDEIKKRTLSEQLIYTSYHDALTGLLNTNCYKKDLEELSSTSLSSVGVVYVDINGLKKRNDEFGHNAGDELIKNVASNLQTAFNEQDIYRIGGDEFIIICKEISEEDFSSRIQMLHSEIKMQENYSISIGHAWSSQHNDIEKLVREADLSMYQDKKQFYEQ